MRLGMAALTQQRASEAERIACGLLDKEPEHAEALHLLGLALLAQKRPRDALLRLEQAARVGRNPVVETHYALALRDLGRKEEAIDWLHRATSHDPPLPVSFHELGILLCSVRRYAEAEAVLKRGLEVAPQAAELSVELGGVYICRADPASAKIAFARALAYVPRHVRALHGFGTALLFEGEFEQAAERFRQVLANSPNHARARLDLAHCMLELGQHQDALEELRTLLRMAPPFFGKALKILVSSGRGRFWMRPSVAAAVLQLDPTVARTLQ